MENNRLKYIQLTRVCAMCMILLCHAFNENKNFNFLGQIFNVGVFTFLFLSGYLYGPKYIKNDKEWLLKRLKKILIPMWLFMVFIFAVRFFLLGYGIEFKSYIVYLFNMQGLLRGVQGATHLWFMTTIMICYLITPLLYKIKKMVLYIDKRIIFIIIPLIISIQYIVAYLTSENIALQISYITLYIFAYYFSCIWDKQLERKKFYLITILTFCIVFVRLISKIFFDGTLLYNVLIVTYSQSILGIWIFLFFYYFTNNRNEKIYFKLINNLDKLSFEIYIVHYMFFVGPLRVMNISNNFFVNSFSAFILSYIFAIILNKVCQRLIKNN